MKMHTRRKVGYGLLFLILSGFTALVFASSDNRFAEAIAMVAAESDAEQPAVLAMTRNAHPSVSVFATEGEVCEMTIQQLEELKENFDVTITQARAGGRTTIVARVKDTTFDREIAIERIGDLGNCIVVKNRHSIILVAPFEIS